MPFFGIYALKRGVKPPLFDDLVFFMDKHIEYYENENENENLYLTYSLYKNNSYKVE